MLWRPTIALGNALFFYALYVVFADYASIEQDIYGFQLGNFSWPDAIFLTLLILVGSLSVPLIIDRPSTMILVIVYIFIIIPFQVMALCTGRGEETDHYIMLATVHSAFFLCVKLNTSRPLQRISRVQDPKLIWLIIVVWLASSGLLYIYFKDVMNLTSLDTIYVQRAAGKANNLFEGYLQTYNQYVFSTALVAFGCSRRNVALILMGLSGALLNFSITAEKAGLIYPIFVVALYLLLQTKRKAVVSTSFIAIMFSIILLVVMPLRSTSSVADLVVWYFGVRTLLAPGHYTMIYQEYFDKWGYTNFSHITGFNLFIPVPGVYAGHPKWPSLGNIIGEDYLQIADLNANANFIASDGIAGFGILGVFMIFVLLAFLLRGLDKLTNGIDTSLTLILLLPIALTLTNGSVFTVLSSFGGFFWALVFWTMFRKDKAHHQSK